MNPPLTIFVVEDNADLCDTLVEALLASGHYVQGVESAEALIEHADFRYADLLVLDINLPGENGLDLARRMHIQCPALGIVMLTARHELRDRCIGYEAGADIYLTKPVSLAELNAAISALGRRLKASTQTQVSLNRAKNAIQLPGGGLIKLSLGEASALAALALAPDSTMEYWQLLEILGKAEDEQGKAQLEVLISRLRAKLEMNGLPEQPLRAIRGKGYRLCMQMVVI